MKHKREAKAERKGFTIIEVALVLAVSGLLLIGIISGVSGSVARQRYNDSVQTIVDDIRALYTAANNPQGASDSGGNSERAIYGTVAIFGLRGSTTGATPIYSGTLIGLADANKAVQTGAALIDFANVAGGGEDSLSQAVSNISTATPPWEAQIQAPSADGGGIRAGVLFIVHSPNGGAVHSYFVSGEKSGTAVKLTNTACGGNNTFINYDNSALSTNIQQLLRKIKNGTCKAEVKDINLCIDSPDLYAAGGIRRNIRILADARNSSAIQLVDVNAEDNQCQ